MSSILDPSKLLTQFDPIKGTIGDALLTRRYLADLRGCFRDSVALEQRLAQDNSLVYTVAAVAPAEGEGDLHYGLGTIYPGLVGNEYFLTKGHLHAWRPAAEVYIGIAGEGVMLLEDEATGESHMLPLEKNSIVYVPGRTAHRTMNVGESPLVYLGVYPARAGHDYSSIAQRNFRFTVVKRDGKPYMLLRGKNL